MNASRPRAWAFGLERGRLSLGLVTVACLLAVGAAGCGSSGASSTKTAARSHGSSSLKSLAYGDPIEADVSLAPVGEGLLALGRTLDIKVYRYNNNGSAATGLTNAELMTRLYPSVIAEWNIVASIGASIGRVFSNAKIPCIAVNVTIPGCPFFNLNDESLGAAEGAAVAPLAKAKGWTSGNTTLILVNAPSAGYTINSVVYGFYSAYAKGFPTMPQMAPTAFTPTTTHVGNLSAVVVNGATDLQDSYTAVKTALQTIPASRHLVVSTLNDDSALGALRALSQAGRAKLSEAMVVGNAADPTGLNELRTNPIWVADGSVFFNSWPGLIVAMAKAMLAGVKPPAQTLPPQVALTKANVNTYYSGATQIASPSLPPVDGYLKPYLPASG